jgi:hypothetical protein
MSDCSWKIGLLYLRDRKTKSRRNISMSPHTALAITSGFSDREVDSHFENMNEKETTETK